MEGNWKFMESIIIGGYGKILLSVWIITKIINNNLNAIEKSKVAGKVSTSFPIAEICS